MVDLILFDLMFERLDAIRRIAELAKQLEDVLREIFPDIVVDISDDLRLKLEIPDRTILDLGIGPPDILHRHVPLDWAMSLLFPLAGSLILVSSTLITREEFERLRQWSDRGPAPCGKN